MINIGNIYDSPGHLKNPKLARYWYKKALAKGMGEGASNLAVHFKMNKKMRWYFYWLQQAANLGDEDSIRELLDLRKESH